MTIQQLIAVVTGFSGFADKLGLFTVVTAQAADSTPAEWLGAGRQAVVDAKYSGNAYRLLTYTQQLVEVVKVVRKDQRRQLISL